MGGFTNIVTHFKNPDASKVAILKDIYYTAPMKYKGSVTVALEGPNADVATEFVEVQVPNEFRSTNGPMSRGCRIFFRWFLASPDAEPGSRGENQSQNWRPPTIAKNFGANMSLNRTKS